MALRKRTTVMRELLNGRAPAAIAKSFPLITRAYIYKLAKELAEKEGKKKRRASK